MGTVNSEGIRIEEKILGFANFFKFLKRNQSVLGDAFTNPDKTGEEYLSENLAVNMRRVKAILKDCDDIAYRQLRLIKNPCKW